MKFATLLFLVAVATAGVSGPAGAAVTYEVSTVNPLNSVNGYGATYVGANGPMSFDFTVATALAANLSPADIVGQVLSYRASGGQAESTITDLDYVGSYKQIELATDALGNITSFHFHVVGQNLLIPNPPTYLDFSFAGTNGILNSADLLFYRADRKFNYGQVDCANANCGGGAIGALAPPGVPEPETWALMIGGFGIAGAALRRRRFASAP